MFLLPLSQPPGSFYIICVIWFVATISTHTQKIFMKLFSVGLKIIRIIFNNTRWRNQGCKKWKKQGLSFVLYFHTFCCLILFVFSCWLCFLFSPPWLEVSDHTSGPNLLKAFIKKIVLKRKLFGLFFSYPTVTLLVKDPFASREMEMLKWNS